MKICYCTGHRPKSFPYPYGKDIIKHKAYLKRLRQTILFIINEYGVTHFISGMAVGFDMDFAETVLNLRDEERYLITLECAIPCYDQTLKWSKPDKSRYDGLLRRTDRFIVISDQYTPECMFKRNRYMVDKSDVIIAFFNGVKKGGTWYTVDYAMKKNKIIKFIDF